MIKDMGIRIAFYIGVLSLFIFGMSSNVSAITVTPSLTPPPACVLKWQGDADCKADAGGKAITLLDFEVWRKEFFGGCAAANPTGCGTSDDGDNNPMDANFNYSGSSHIPVDQIVNTIDFEIWRKGYFETGTPSPTLSISPTYATPTPTPTPSGPPGTGIWISKPELMLQPTAGPAWDELLSVATRASSTGADIANQDSNHDVETLAAALVCARKNDQFICSKARTAVVSAINTEEGARWLAVGRNLGSYVIAADLLGLTADSNPNSEGSRVHAWLTRFYTRTLQANNDPSTQHTARQSAWASGSNASAQEGFAYAALAAYLGRKDGLDWSWNAYRRYIGDRTSTHQISSNDLSWQFKPTDIVGIQDAGAIKGGCRLDGAIANDMSRGGTYSCSPGFTQYPWVGLEGAVPAALIMERAGHPAFTAVNNAILRTHEYLWELRQRTGDANWFDGSRANEIIHLINWKYNKNFLISYPIGLGRTVGFTDWTHN